MKKITLIFVIILILTLSSCITPSETNLNIKLNPGVDTIEVGEVFIDAGADANYGYRQLTPTIVENTVDISKVGVYEITYQIEYLDYQKSVTRYVTVIDQRPPELSLNPGIDTIAVGQTWVDASIQAIDDSLEDIVIDVEGTVDINTAGQYIITYYATDTSGNTSHIDRYVTVINPS